MFFLATELGMTVQELTSKLTKEEYTNWLEYYELKRKYEEKATQNEKDKSKNLVKRVSKLKSINYFKGLGTYFDKVQRMRKLGGMLSDNLMISKDKVELSASICKVDLVSELVGEFPELQGVMGGYFANVQGFDKEISLAISEQYMDICSCQMLWSLPYF